jgi:DNA-binding NtrC family response regulator
LLQQYLAYFAAAMNAEVRGLTVGADSAALGHKWPGNVRELRNRVERAVALAVGPWLGAADLFPDRHHQDGQVPEIPSLAAARQEAERRHIMAALERTAGQVGKAAEILAVSRSTLWEKMRKLGISVDETA